MDAQRQVENILRHARLLRTKHHNVFLLANGRRWVTPKTPSDAWAWRNNLADLRRVLGLRRRPKKKRRPEALPPRPPAATKAEWTPPPRAEPPHIVPTSYHWPPVAPLRPRLGNRASSRTLKGHSLSAEVIAEANRVLKQEGQGALDGFLRGEIGKS